MIIDNVRNNRFFKGEFFLSLFLEKLITDTITASGDTDFAKCLCQRHTTLNLSSLSNDIGIISYHIRSSNELYHNYHIYDNLTLEVRLYVTYLDNTLINQDRLQSVTSLLINYLTNNRNSSTKDISIYSFQPTGCPYIMNNDITMNELIEVPFASSIREASLPNHITTTFVIKFQIFK